MVLASKPFTMSCYELASQLRLLNTLSIYLPGSGGSLLYPDDTTMKNAFYCLMLPQWRLNFDDSGNQLDNTNYTINRLISYMEQQHLHYNAQEELKKRQQPHKRPPYRNPPAMNRFNNFQLFPCNYQPYPNFNTPSCPNWFNNAPMRSSRTRPNTNLAYTTPAWTPPALQCQVTGFQWNNAEQDSWLETRWRHWWIRIPTEFWSSKGDITAC